MRSSSCSLAPPTTNLPPSHTVTFSSVDRKVVDFPADAEEPDYDWMDAETWAKIRKPRPHSSAFWRVRLDCGHYEQVCTDLDWKPENGPQLVSEERSSEIRQDFEEIWIPPPRRIY